MNRINGNGKLVDIHHVSQAVAASVLGVTARSMRDWNAPRNADATYDLPVLVQWRLNGSGSMGDLDLNTERARLAKWQADKTHQDVELRAGTMLLEEDVRHWVAGMIATARQRLVQIPETVRQVVHPDYAESVASEVRRLIYEALAELAAHREDGPRSDVAAMGAASQLNGQPVGGSVSKAVKRKQRGAGAMEN